MRDSPHKSFFDSPTASRPFPNVSVSESVVSINFPNLKKNENSLTLKAGRRPLGEAPQATCFLLPFLTGDGFSVGEDVFFTFCDVIINAVC